MTTTAIVTALLGIEPNISKQITQRLILRKRRIHPLNPILSYLPRETIGAPSENEHAFAKLPCTK